MDGDISALWFYTLGVVALCGCIWGLIYIRIFLPDQLAERVGIVVLGLGMVGLGTILVAIAYHATN